MLYQWLARNSVQNRPSAIVGLLLSILVTGLSSHAWSDGAPNAEAGRTLASAQCARCHAIETSGESPLAQAPPFRTFAAKWPLENLEESLAEGIVVGHKDMPEFALTPGQIADFIAYLRAVQAK